MTTLFEAKLNAIPETVEAVFAADITNLARMMGHCAGVPVFAVGSGGSSVVIEFLAQCRSQLGHSVTSSLTPMAYVLQNGDPSAKCWFFSASGDNQDIQAAFEAGGRLSPETVFVLTNASNGALATQARRNGSSLFVAPVADAKDGFLATHSAISSTLSLVLASDRLIGREEDQTRKSDLSIRIAKWLAPEARYNLQRLLGSKLDCETLVILHDPQLTAAATLIETSAWEAGLCSVQKTDFRNFAHGRHVWLDKHPSQTLVLSLTAERSEISWQVIDGLLPENVTRASYSFQRAGRAAQLEAVAFGLAFVEALGSAKGIDPGKPGVADFGRKMFDDGSLRTIVTNDAIAVRRKRRAAIQVDSEPSPVELISSRTAYVREIEADQFGGIVLDYDGTVVATEKRYDPPDADILSELRRLLDGEIWLGFASGRGGSIGEALRQALPASYHPQILIGYFNGALIEPLNVDIRDIEMKRDEAIVEARRRLVNLAGLFKDGWAPKDHGLQLTIPRKELQDEFQGPMWLVEALADLPVRILQSGHSVDIFPHWASKRDVIVKIRSRLREPAAAVLCLGDRGERLGNDHDLLAGPHGMSVGKVCDRPYTCWNLAPENAQGPLGLQLLLQALKVVSPGAAKLKVPHSFCFG